MNRNIAFGTLCLSILLILGLIVSQQEVNSSNLVQLNSPAKESKITPIASNIQMNRLANANNRFGFKLFNQIQTQQPDENIVISPHSIAIALAMVAKATNGTTQQEIVTALELDRLDPTSVDGSYLKLIETLSNADPNLKIAIANSVWVDRNITLKPKFIEDLEKFYQAQVNNLDFADTQAKNTINDWVADNTNDKITQIIDSISPEDALYLINAVYFKSNWSNQFDPNATTEAPFYPQPDSSSPHQMMNQTGEYRYHDNEQFQAVRIPYGDKQELGMYIFLPQQSSSLEMLNERLNPDNWQEWLSMMRSRRGNITIPKFELEYEQDLPGVLSALGINSIFNSSNADFSAMTDTPVAVDTIKHKTYMEVNETGTEAAAVTSIGIRVTSLDPENVPFNMNVDRPFFFAIRDDITETILFMGNVVQP